jgi:hypothetical protein
MWWWILGWALLILLALVFHAWLGWRLVKQAVRLGRQLGDSAEQARPIMEVGRQPYQPAVSVLVDPSTGPSSAGSGAGRRASA